MSLYEYDLYLIRELDRGGLLSEIVKAGCLKIIEKDEACILEGINCFFTETVNRVVSSCPLCIVKLELDDKNLERFLQSDGKRFISWLKHLVQECDIAYAFIGGGDCADYYEEGKISSELVFSQVGHLVETGKVEIVHPVMFFAERLGQGRTCALAKGAPFCVEDIPGVGCLLLLASHDVDGKEIEILDPGRIYYKLRNYFKL